MRSQTHEAGAIIVTFSQLAPQVLLITSKANANHWLFPKGHVEPGESMQAAALREAAEEAGVRGELIGPAGTTSFVLAGQTYAVDYFLVETNDSGRPEEGRRLAWYSYRDALTTLSFGNLRELLAAAWPNIEDIRDHRSPGSSDKK